MPFNWNNYITLAEELNSETHPTEQKMRSATSRAYYGAFILCRNKKGKSMKKEGAVHKEIIDEFKLSDNSTEISIGNYLSDLRKCRNEADYDGHVVFKKQSTNLHIEKAKKIVELLKKLEK